MPSLFAQLIHTIGDDRLRRHIDERTLLHLPGVGAACTSWLTLDDIGAAIAQGLLPRPRLWSGRNIVDLDRMGAISEKRVVAPVLESLTRQPVTLAVNLVDRAMPLLWDVARDAEAAFARGASFGAIASFGPDSGLAKHFDRYDLLVIQLAGAKRWHLHGEPVPFDSLASPRHDSDPTDAVRIVDLAAGDVMLVPAGLTHHCTAIGHSLHIGLTLDMTGIVDDLPQPRPRIGARPRGPDPDGPRINLAFEHFRARPSEPDRTIRSI